MVSLGEALVDLVSLRKGTSLNGAPDFRMAAGGAPANVAVGVARLGIPATFVGAVGKDPLGAFLVRQLQQCGVDTRGVTRTRARQTALALVSLTSKGDPEFLFYGKPGAHLGLRITPRIRSIIRRSRIFHFGSITLIAAPSRLATLSALREARRAGCLCSYDPNLRLNLWPDARTAHRWILVGLRYAHCVKVNEKELIFLTGQRDIGSGLRVLLKFGARVAVVTLGPKGCVYRTQDAEGHVPGLSARVVDTTGAGDAFVAGMLVGFLEEGVDLRYRIPTTHELERVLTFANAAAALSTQRRGGVPSLPSRGQLKRFFYSHYRGDACS